MGVTNHLLTGMILQVWKLHLTLGLSVQNYGPNDLNVENDHTQTLNVYNSI